MTIEEATAYVANNGMSYGDDGLPIMPDRDSVPDSVWRDCQAAYRALSGGKTYPNPETCRPTYYGDPDDPDSLD